MSTKLTIQDTISNIDVINGSLSVLSVSTATTTPYKLTIDDSVSNVQVKKAGMMAVKS